MTAKLLPLAEAGEVKTASFRSEALGVEKSYLVYLPAGYEQGEVRYPVVYMLHGIGGDEDDWSKMNLIDAPDELSLPAIIIMIDGEDSFYANSATLAGYDVCLKVPRPFGHTPSPETYCVRSADYETYVASDMGAHVDSTYRTIAKREARAIGGLPMGGFGALMIVMRHKDTFSSAASH
ncbi:MAG: esterase family protein [Myxococcales bacterium]|nr:esterase family protein [Myxococcales bacterium]